MKSPIPAIDQSVVALVHHAVHHLGELLLEVAVEQLRAIREHRERDVDAHGADRLLPFGVQLDIGALSLLNVQAVEERMIGEALERFADPAAFFAGLSLKFGIRFPDQPP